MHTSKRPIIRIPKDEWNRKRQIEYFERLAVKDYRTFKRIVLGPLHLDTGFTKHYAQDQLQLTPRMLEIVQYPGQSQFYLFYIDSHNEVQNDTFHESMDDAMMQALLEFRVSPEEWEVVDDHFIGDANGVPQAIQDLQTQPVSVAEISPDDPQPRVDVYLTVAGTKSLNLMQVLVESVPGIGLLSAKTIVENAPRGICTDAPAGWASQIKAQLEKFGATVELRPTNASRS